MKREAKYDARVAAEEARLAAEEEELVDGDDDLPIDDSWRNGKPAEKQGKSKREYRRIWDRYLAPMGQALRDPFEGLPDPRLAARRAAASAAEAVRDGAVGLKAAGRPFVPSQPSEPTPVPRLDRPVGASGLRRPPVVVPRRPASGRTRVDRLRPTVHLDPTPETRPDPTRTERPSSPTRPVIAGGSMFGISDAAQSLAAFNPDEPTQMKNALMALPGEIRDLGAGFAALAENIAANYPYAPSVADTLRELGAAVSATEQGAEDAAMAFVREHEVDLNRHESPRANEQHWNVRG
ncbi:hypothetical protein [Actinoalloteichus sp. GBA129-24]|uniref:hypothetical protein n=1 Tax=Actinoalloteichus sp. GBA129-24 TaxID=1612551 RepID=UPI0012F83206|nr:hypothetical protein [Actinoalloteichus sp. GBA129-24]